MILFSSIPEEYQNWFLDKLEDLYLHDRMEKQWGGDTNALRIEEKGKEEG